MISPRLSFSALMLLSACCCLTASVASAAIITERNDTNIYPPNYATFVGTPSWPGIDSCWIPYGTYTDGIGGTEYLRVTSNLIGVVASAFDGVLERGQLGTSATWRLLLVPFYSSGLYEGYADHGEFLASATNNTLRIRDLLNEEDFVEYIARADGTNEYRRWGWGENIESRLAKEDVNAGVYYHSGLCAPFGSRCLDDIVGAQEPPLSAEWTSDLPFKAADSNLWATVWPTYSAVTNDIHFFDCPSNAIPYFERNHIYEWMYGHLVGIWGNDVIGGVGDGHGEDLSLALLTIPLPCNMEEVLSYDTGWKYEVPPVETASVWRVAGQTLRWYVDGEYWQSDDDERFYIQLSYSIEVWYFSIYDREAEGFVYDETLYAPGDSDTLDFPQIGGYGPYTATRTRYYANTDDYTHWRNMTTRLDWKRLGIICQLERQMEQTYEVIPYTDELPLWHMSTSHGIGYQSSEPLEINFPVAEYDGQVMDPIYDLFSGVSWGLSDDRYYAATNILGWSTPTCRTPSPILSEGAGFDNEGQPIYLTEENATNLLEFLVSQLQRYTTNRIVHAGFYGHWGAGTGMSIEYNASYAEGVEIVTMPSNTVEVSASDGFHDSAWRDYPIAQDRWTFSEDAEGSSKIFVFSPDTPISGAAALSYDTRDLTNTLQLTYWQQNAFSDDGSVTMPTMTFTASGGGPVTNWLWRVDGIETYDESWCIRTVTAEGVTWHFEATGIDISYWFSGRYRFSAINTLANGAYALTFEGTGEIPSRWSSPTLTASWDTSTCEVEEINTDYGPLAPFALPVTYDSTNDSRVAYAGITKETQPTFTWAAEETRTATISRFASPYSSLDWSRVKTLRRSELEVMLSATGGTYAYDTSPSPGAFNWEAIRNYGGQREFRFLLGTTANSLNDANAARYNMLAALSDACKRECADRGGMSIVTLSNVGRLTQDEKEVFLKDLKRAIVSGTFIVKGSEDDDPERGIFNGMWIGGDKNGDDEWDVTELGRISNVPPDQPPSPFYPFLIGGCGWECSIEVNSSITNSYKSVRADAHQAPVRKILWKFKNLRDPDL